MKSNLQTEFEFNPEPFGILESKKKKWRFGKFHFHSTRICQAVLTSFMQAEICLTVLKSEIHVHSYEYYTILFRLKVLGK